MTVSITPLGWVVLAGVAAAGAYFLSHPGSAAAAQASWWVPVRSGGKLTGERALWPEYSGATHGPPTYYDKNLQSWTWIDSKGQAITLKAEPKPTIETV
jgi:hypothetical protein